MSNAPIFELDMLEFQKDPYPQLKRMRRDAPIAFVPQLNSHMMTKHKDIFENEKLDWIFSSVAPGSPMEQTIGTSMILKDGESHTSERQMINPPMSPKAMRESWIEKFNAIVDDVINEIENQNSGDLFSILSARMAADALAALTGLTQINREEITQLCDGLIAGISNMFADEAIADAAQNFSKTIDHYIDDAKRDLQNLQDTSMLAAFVNSGASDEQIRSNIKLAIAGGLNEPRAGLAGTLAALLTHPEALNKCLSGEVSWRTAFEEYCRWHSPIGFAPRILTQEHAIGDVTFEPGDSVLLMWRSGNRDEEIFEDPDKFDVCRSNLNKSMTFGSGPHFCAGAFAARTLICEAALPKIFEKLNGLRLAAGASVEYTGAMFRHPVSVPCEWN